MLSQDARIPKGLPNVVLQAIRTLAIHLAWTRHEFDRLSHGCTDILAFAFSGKHHHVLLVDKTITLLVPINDYSANPVQ